MKKKLDDLTVRNLKTENMIYFCMALGETGFGIRVYPSGVKVFVFRYKVDGVQKLLNLGEYPATSLKDARDEYLKASLKVKDLRRGKTDGSDPVQEIKRVKEQRIAEATARKEALSVSDLCKEYLEKYAMKFKKSWKQDEDLLNRDVIPVWVKRKVDDIKKRDVTLLLEGIVERGSPSMSNSVFRVIRKMFNFAVERDILQYSPCLGVKELAPNPSRDRVLSESEIKTVWQTIGNAAMSPGTKLAVKLVLVTAQRPGEAAGMHTSEINGNIWTIPKERAKNRKEHRVYLTALAQNIIEQAIEHAKFMREMKPEEDYSGFVFPCREYAKVQPIQVTAMAKSILRSLEWPLTDTKGKPLYNKDGTQATENKLGVEPFTLTT